METRYIPPTMAGVITTLHAMRSLALQGGKLTRATSRAILATAGRASFPADLRRWLARHWTETPDPPGVEVVMSPEYQLIRAAGRSGELRGDCDDIATLGAGMALASGFASRYCAIARVGPTPTHVYAEVQGVDGGWVDLDILDRDGTGKAHVCVKIHLDV